MSAAGTAPALLAETFNAYFQNWRIEISAADVQAGKQGSVVDHGWRVNYLVDADDTGELFLEFYATHRMTDDRHVLISSSGVTKHLDAIVGMYRYDPNVGGSEDRARRANIEHNRRVAEGLEAKGLFPSGDINTFLRTGGMEAADALKEMERLLTETGLPMPPMPNELRHSLHRVRRWCYATRDVDPLAMYRFLPYLIEAVVTHPEPYVALSHAGHGINSYAINYQLVTGRVTLFVQVPWGGVYFDEERQATAVRHMFGKCAELLDLISNLADGPRLLLAVSELRSLQWCGWMPSGLDEAAAGRWLRSEELSVEDPFVVATNLLKEADTTGGNMKESGGVTCFDDMSKERPDFLDWRAQNPLGFVLRLSETRFKLHLASCPALEVIGPDSLANPKCCAPVKDALLRLTKARGRRVEDCPACLP